MVKGAAAADGSPARYGLIVKDVLAAAVPVALTVATFGAAWWYVLIYNAPVAVVSTPPGVAAPSAAPSGAAPAPAEPQMAAPSTPEPERVQELGEAETEVKSSEPLRSADAPPEEVGSVTEAGVAGAGKVPAHFFEWFWGLAAFSALVLVYYFWRMDGEGLEILKELVVSVVPLGVLTVVVLAVILFGICTATESAAIGALGALYLAVMAKYQRQVWWWSLVGAIIGVGLGWWEGEDSASLIVAGSIGGTLVGTVIPVLTNLRTSAELRLSIKQATFLTAKTTAMVCWLFVGSGLFSAVFALHGGQGLIERWVLSMNLSPMGFQFMAQLIIFLLGWPLEWTEIIIIFCPIFIPLLSHFQVDPILFGTMVAVNLQAAFLSPPVAMSAF
jgi:TRAP-type mannitol/chloroaromatic compound transport system permease large subunit